MMEIANGLLDDNTDDVKKGALKRTKKKKKKKPPLKKSSMMTPVIETPANVSGNTIRLEPSTIPPAIQPPLILDLESYCNLLGFQNQLLIYNLLSA